MDSTARETRTVRVGALLVHLAALVAGAVLVVLEVWSGAAAAAVIAVVAGAWARSMYVDQREADRFAASQRNAAHRFTPPDDFEG
jgi:CHASE2 domain-containing sensor protein